MVWTSATKHLGVAKIVAHALTRQNVAGRTATGATISFLPQALWGAAARCSHLIHIDPTLLTPQSQMMAAMIERHVDDAGGVFAIRSSADELTEFLGTTFTGTVAAGLGYLKMIDEGYVWSDHWKNLGGSTATKKSPDFVFASVGKGVALMESKGSRSADASHFDSVVKRGYLNQVEPHLGNAVSGLIATHGYCVGSYLHSTSQADLRIHHTAIPVPATRPAGGSRGDPASIAVVQRGNFANAFTLAHSMRLGQAIRDGESLGDIPFRRFSWRGRSWVTAPRRLPYEGPDGRRDHPVEVRPYWFAIDAHVAGLCLAGLMDGGRREPALLPEIAPMLAGRDDGSSDGVIFPDGLAVVGPLATWQREREAMWRFRAAQFD